MVCLNIWMDTYAAAIMDNNIPNNSIEEAHPNLEEELVLKAQAGDLQAFESLIKPYHSKIYGFAYHLAGNPTDAEDLFQEAFLRVYQNIKHFRMESSFSTWLYAVSKSTFINELKKRHRISQNKEFIDNLLYKEGTEETGKTDLQITVNKILDEMPINLKMPVILYDLQGYGYEEMAEMLGTTIPAVRCRLSKGRKLFKEKINKLEIFKGFGLSK